MRWSLGGGIGERKKMGKGAPFPANVAHLERRGSEVAECQGGTARSIWP